MKKFKPLAILLLFTLSFFSLTAKAGNNGNHYANGRRNSNDCNNGRVPIDGGISLLFAAGAAFGIKKVADKNKKKNLPL